MLSQRFVADPKSYIKSLKGISAPSAPLIPGLIVAAIVDDVILPSSANVKSFPSPGTIIGKLPLGPVGPVIPI